MIDLARMITTIIPGSKAEFITTQEDDRNDRVSSEKIQQLLGLECRYTIDEGIALLADWVRKNRPDYQDPIYHNHMYRDHERANGNAGHAEGLVNGEHSAVVPEARSFARTEEPTPV